MLEKLNCYVAKVSIFLITIALIAGMAGCDGYPPCPTPPPSQNLEIRDWFDLNDVRNNLAGNHTLMNDLDSTTPGYEELASPTANQGKGWEPIETFIPMCPYGCFTGTFDGQGYEIRDVFINRPDEYLVGLFGCVDEVGVIKDIGVMNFTVIGKSSVGGLAGSIRGTVSNSYAIGNVSGDSSVGGLVGYNQGPVSNCYATGTVAGELDVGGLVGCNMGFVNNSYSASSVTGNSSVGGLVGQNSEGTVSNSHWTGSVVGNSFVGGVVGYNFMGSMSNCYSTGSVTGDEYVGGIVGSPCYGIVGLLGSPDYIMVTNSHYDYDEVLINGQNIITVGALLGEDFDQWLANDKFLDVNERLSQENGYYVVNNVTDFKELLAFGQDSSLKFRLANDLDLGADPNFYIPYLAGEFDGNGHKISNLSFNFDFVANVGLFGYLAPGGKVTHVGVENVNIRGAGAVGGLVGDTWEGIVSDSYASGTVTGGSWVGGLVGWNGGTVSNSHSTGSVTGESSVGGLVGFDRATVDSSYSTSSVTGNTHVGGLVGSHGMGTVSNSYSSGTVTGDMHAGGLVGLNFGLGIVSNSYATGSVTGDEYVGGLIGSNGDRGTVSNSYSTGRVTGNTHVGGLVGHNYFGTGKGTVSNCFWDTETSRQATSDGGMGKNTTEMQDITTFTDTETQALDKPWDIIAVANPGTHKPSYIWNIVNGVTYPFLSWQA